MIDLRIEHCCVIDTISKTSQIANIAVHNGKIIEITHTFPEAERVIDATGLYAAPGFIDVHSHLDGYAYGARLSAAQGITTSVGGNCGLSPLNMPEFFEAQTRSGYLIHQTEQIGHSFTLRKAAGIESTAAAAASTQLSTMLKLADNALRAGACGISLGLDYAPGASFDEIAAMAALAASYRRVLSVHTRLFTQNDLNSLYEIFAITKKTGVRLLLSHFVYQYSGFGSMRPALEIVDRARADGLDVWIDSGMYTDWATFVHTATFDEQTMKDISLRFADMVVATGKYIGTRLNEDLYRLLRRKYPDTSVICYSGEPYEIYETLARPYAMMSTDCGCYAPGEGHPQIAGSYPRYLRKMVREHRLLSVEEAVYKASLLPAQTFGLIGKGVLAPGYDADIVLFNLHTVRDHAKMPDKGEPDAPPSGIPYVFVDGTAVIDNGRITSALPGRILRITHSATQF